MSLGLMHLARLVGQRLAAGAVTLLLLSALVFAGARLLPGDAGRAILGPLADPAAVAALDHQLGTDRPLLAQYAGWAGGFVAGDMGRSYAYRAPAAPYVLAALRRSLKLAAVAFAMVVPLSVGAGVYAATRAGRWQDRAVTLAGLSLAVVPEFVSALALILVFGVRLRWLPVSAGTPPGAAAAEQLRPLLLPARPLGLVLFGYIARVARAGTLAALDADYTRTAVLKGLPRRTVLLRHVLRNALLPTITVAATQVGYLIGGLVVVETLFRSQGIGSLVLQAARAKDFPMLEAGILVVGVVYLVATLLADILTALLDPRAGSR